MQNKQLKRPYSPPEITAVEFRVEVGQQTSLEIQNTFQGQVDENNQMLFLMMQNANGQYQNNNNAYFGEGASGWNSDFWGN